MKAYFDTSFLVPLLVPEENSERIEKVVQEISLENAMLVSQWTRVEMASVFSRLVRMGELEQDAAQACDRAFSTMVDESFEIVTPGLRDFDLCHQYLARFDNSLRAGDALHLAIAANHGAQVIYTLDKGMLKIGTKLGLPLRPDR